MMYDIHMHFNLFDPTNNGSKYITTTFTVNTRKDIHIVCVYKVHSCLVSMF
jgi:hypothetical protein